MKTLKLYISLILLAFTVTISAQTQAPDWVTDRPSGMMDYIGIASASKTQDDYREIAKKAAMSELLSQIEVTVSANSLMNVTENDNILSSHYSESVKTTATQLLFNLDLFDTWEDDNNFWVYYRLDKEEYARKMKEMIDTATKQGVNYWQDGTLAVQQGDLLSGIDHFIKGLQAIEPFANKDLVYESDGQSYSLGNLLYTSLRNVFQGIMITSEPTEVTMESFKGGAATITLLLTKDNVPLSNMKLKARFNNGSGNISPIAATGTDGQTTCDILNITSKNPNQSLRFTLDTENLKNRNNSTYKQLISQLEKNIPECIIRIGVTESTPKAYISADQNKDRALVRSLRAMINNKYFDIVENEEEADVIIKVSANFKQGAVVKGDMYDMKEYFTSIYLSFTDSNTGRELTSYSLEGKRTLVSAKQSATGAKNAALRDAMKTVKRQLPETLKNMKLNNL